MFNNDFFKLNNAKKLKIYYDNMIINELHFILE